MNLPPTPPNSRFFFQTLNGDWWFRIDEPGDEYDYLIRAVGPCMRFVIASVAIYEWDAQLDRSGSMVERIAIDAQQEWWEWGRKTGKEDES